MLLQAKPPLLVVASGDKEKVFRVPEGTKFTVNGKEMALSDLREGMQVKGTVVTAIPTTALARINKVSGEAPKPVDTPVLVGVLLIEELDMIEK